MSVFGCANNSQLKDELESDTLKIINWDLPKVVVSSDLITGEFQRKNPLPDKSYNELIQEHFNAK